MKSGDVVVWDGLATHKDSPGARIVLLQPYSPHMNPIEYAWSLAKRHLRSAKVRATDALRAAIAAACAAVSAEVASAFIRHCGYGPRMDESGSPRQPPAARL